MCYATATAVLLLLIIPLLAAPTSSSHLVIPSHPPITYTSLSHSFSFNLHHSVNPSHTLPRPPAGTNPPHQVISSSSPYEQDPNVQQRQKKLIIGLGIIAGFVSFGFLGCVIRCMHKYKAPPKRDRIAEVLQRHNLQCELEELERNPYALRRLSLREPAPPYSPRPPSYTESVLGAVLPESKASQLAVPFTQPVHPSG